MDALNLVQQINRRHFLGRAGLGLGAMALGSLAAKPRAAEHFPAKAKRVIYLFQSGAPSQMDLFDPKPALRKSAASTCPTQSAWVSALPR